jgi:hypothetical protein
VVIEIANNDQKIRLGMGLRRGEEMNCREVLCSFFILKEG